MAFTTGGIFPGFPRFRKILKMQISVPKSPRHITGSREGEGDAKTFPLTGVHFSSTFNFKMQGNILSVVAKISFGPTYFKTREILNCIQMLKLKTRQRSCCSIAAA